ncbi:MAG: hypothetical protein LBL98_07965 [Ruminococcus sp.]|jgi:hypothetical protein|nr:hypothetical protein [Ruminococcus sp.]
MKKEEIIAKAFERNITINEDTAEKLTELSEEELENLAGAAGEPSYELDENGVQTGARYIYLRGAKVQIC